VVVFTDHACDDGFSADGAQVVELGHVAGGLRCNVRGTLLPRLMRPLPVVMDQTLLECWAIAESALTRVSCPRSSAAVITHGQQHRPGRVVGAGVDQAVVAGGDQRQQTLAFQSVGEAEDYLGVGLLDRDHLADPLAGDQIP
jgi:hypothetical protein